MRTIENNKLIAEFLGYPKNTYKEAGAKLVDNTYVWYLKDVDHYYIDGEWIDEVQLRFDTEWNWIMKAVDKIESFEDDNRCAKYNINIEQSFVEIIDKNTDDTIVDTDADTKIEATYNAVIEFIKYYNKQDENNNRN